MLIIILNILVFTSTGAKTHDQNGLADELGLNSGPPTLVSTLLLTSHNIQLSCLPLVRHITYTQDTSFTSLASKGRRENKLPLYRQVNWELESRLLVSALLTATGCRWQWLHQQIMNILNKNFDIFVIEAKIMMPKLHKAPFLWELPCARLGQMSCPCGLGTQHHCGCPVLGLCFWMLPLPRVSMETPCARYAIYLKVKIDGTNTKR